MQKQYVYKVHQVDGTVRNEVTEEWWNDLYKNHSLPIGSYHVMDDGAIVMEPKEPRDEELGKKAE